MKNNERGGVISKIFFLPVALALMAGFFILGYSVGRYRSASGGPPAGSTPPLPEIVSKNLPNPDEFTFYKTLTDKSDKIVSIDLQPKSSSAGKNVGKNRVGSEAPLTKGQQRVNNERAAETRSGLAPKQAPARKEVSSEAKNSRLRYSLQIASYPEKEMAETDIRNLKQRGYAAFIVASDLPGKGTWYRVRLGSFSNKTSAEKLQKELQAKESISSIISIE